MSVAARAQALIGRQILMSFLETGMRTQADVMQSGGHWSQIIP